MRWLLPLLATATCLFTTAYALSCIPCGSSPCETPQCCDSGSYTSDVCGCCDVCAKAKGDGCGGPWGIEGRCGFNMSCHRKCKDCTTVTGKSCIFPFKYKGNEYNNCTMSDSEDVWCALAVDEFNEVIPGKWEDCASGCPGTKQECNSNDLFNTMGRCISNSDRKNIEESMEGRTVSQQTFDSGASENKPAPFCNLPDSHKCKCDEAGCKKPSWGEPGFDSGWCFLIHVQEPSKPTKNCYSDVYWSSTHGQFWSSEACKESINAIPTPPPPPKVIVDDIEDIIGNQDVIEIQEPDGTPFDPSLEDELPIDGSADNEGNVSLQVGPEPPMNGPNKDKEEEEEAAPPAPPSSADRILPPSPPPPTKDEDSTSEATPPAPPPPPPAEDSNKSEES